jgi:hypothetical protein
MWWAAIFSLSMTAQAGDAQSYNGEQWPTPPDVERANGSRDYHEARRLLEAEITRCESAGDRRACWRLWNQLRSIARMLGDKALENVAAINEFPPFDREIKEGQEKAARGEMELPGLSRADALEGLGRLVEAEPLRRAEVIAAREKYGDPSILLTFAITALAKNLGRQRRVDEAIALYREALTICMTIQCATLPGMDGPAYFAADEAAELLEASQNFIAAQAWRERQVELATTRTTRLIALQSLLANLRRQGRVREMRYPMARLIAETRATGEHRSRNLARLHAQFAIILSGHNELAAARSSAREGTETALRLFASADAQSAKREQAELSGAFRAAVYINWKLAAHLARR